MDLECLGRGKWRCRNCDAVLSEGAELRHHRDYYCRHPQSAGKLETTAGSVQHRTDRK